MAFLGEKAGEQGGNRTNADAVLNASVQPGSDVGPGYLTLGSAANQAGVFRGPAGLNAGFGAIAPKYVDLNGTGGYFLGVTGGLFLSQSGYNWYAGPALTAPFGGASVTAGWGAEPSVGWSVGLAANYVIAGQVGWAFGVGSFWEIGLGFPPGLTVVGFYTFPGNSW
jgi:hypothetical protein